MTAVHGEVNQARCCCATASARIANLTPPLHVLRAGAGATVEVRRGFRVGRRRIRRRGRGPRTATRADGTVAVTHGTRAPLASEVGSSSRPLTRRCADRMVGGHALGLRAERCGSCGSCLVHARVGVRHLPQRRSAGRRDARRRGGFAEVEEDAADRGRVSDERDEAHLGCAERAAEREDLIDPGEQLGPGVTAVQRFPPRAARRPAECAVVRDPVLRDRDCASAGRCRRGSRGDGRARGGARACSVDIRRG